MKPRTLWACQPKVFISVFNVDPPGAFIKVIAACSVSAALARRDGDLFRLVGVSAFYVIGLAWWRPSSAGASALTPLATNPAPCSAKRN